MSLADPRVVKQAKVLVDYSLKVKRGEKVVVLADFQSEPLIKEIYRLLIRRGAYKVKLKIGSYEFSEIYFKEAKNDQLDYFPKIDMDEIKYSDCYIRIKSPLNTRGLTNVDTKKISRRSRVLRKITNYRVENTRWVVTIFPTHAQAQEADMSLSEYEDFVFTAINKVDWKKVHKDQEKLRKLVDNTAKVRIVGKGTDLQVSIRGRKAVNAGGENNMPDGEVFTSVVENSTKGFITYSFPALYLGKEFHDVRLEFKSGKVVNASAEKGEKDLNKILDVDKGARYVGELGIGNNFKIQKFTKDILFDEKIGGTVHIALGKGYKETKSLNKSAIHWDMIKDLRNGGELWFDDKLVQRNGRWIK
jgi:aminopeptidase